MSIIHINQIKNRLEKLFANCIDMSDQKLGTESYKSMLLSRSLAAYAIHHFTDCTPEEAGKSIIDGADDNGIDAIYFDENELKLYLVQSKWSNEGKGEPENFAIKKFTSGIRDLLSLNLDRFNLKVLARSEEISSALNNAGLQIMAILVHTGTAELSIHSQRDFKDLLDEVNDASEMLEWRCINQGLLHNSLTQDLNSPITASIAIRYWGKVQEPRYAIYGQVCALDLAKLWISNKERIVAKNLRGALGETDVNSEIRDTLENKSNLFWYFNNGITATAASVEKLAIGGGTHELGIFKCEGIHIVNGAQTVSTIGRYFEKNPEADLSNCFVHFRVVSLEDGGEEFGDAVTRTNNRQNKIETRDFVSQDIEQKRIKNELLIDGIHYQIMRSDDLPRGGTVFDLQDSTTALVCASGDISLVVTLKSQIGKLWEDITKKPYKNLFNPDVSGLYVWRCIQVQRLIDESIEAKRARYTKPRENRILTYGNRQMSALIFRQLPISKFKDPSFDFKNAITEELINTYTHHVVYEVIEHAQRFYQNSIISSLFKNQTKSRSMFDAVDRKVKEY